MVVPATAEKALNEEISEVMIVFFMTIILALVTNLSSSQSKKKGAALNRLTPD